MALDILARMFDIPAEAMSCIPTTCPGESHERYKQQGLNYAPRYLRRLRFIEVFAFHNSIKLAEGMPIDVALGAESVVQVKLGGSL